MFCNRCGTEARPGQRFCAECGAALTPAPEPTQPVDTITDDEPQLEPTQPVDTITDDEPQLEPTQPIDTITDDEPQLEPTQPIDTITDDEPQLEPTQPIGTVADDTATSEADEPQADLPPPPATTPPPNLPPSPARASAPPPRLYDLALDEPDLLVDSHGTAVATDQLPPTPPLPATDELPETVDVADDEAGGVLASFRIGVVSGVGLVAGMAALFGMFTRVVGIRTDARTPAFDTGDWLVADLGTNLPGAMIVALVTLLVGVVGAGFRQRWGAGVAGGAGLAIAGWTALTIGLSERPVEAALDAVRRPSAETFTVTITRDVGYWVLLAAGALGLATFVVSLASAGRDRRRGLNPWIASLGAVSAVVAAAGPMLPQGAATVEDNWSPGSGGLGLPTWFVVGRLVQLGLLAYAGVVGFLLVRRYGLGLAIGGMSVAVWLSVSTLLGLGDAPVGPGYANPGATPADGGLHAVTVVGMIALVGLAIVAVIAAYDQAAREYP